MKNRLLLIFVLFGFLAIGASYSLIQQSLPDFSKSKSTMEDHADNKDLWKQVDSLAAQGLPQSALELVNDIYQSAQKTGDMPEFLKAAI